MPDHTLHCIRSDFFALAQNKVFNYEREDWLKALAANLRALATMVENNELPDPFPIFRREQE